MGNRPPLKIEIAGRSFPIKSGSSENHIKKLEEYIDSKYQKLRESKSVNIGSSFERDLVLLLINIANDSIEDNEKLNTLKKEMLIKIEKLIEKIDSIL